MVDPDAVFANFVAHADGMDIAVIEGNRGLFDGKDVSGTQSTAELAKLLKAPVVLVVNAKKSTRTIAALVKGCIDFDPDVNVAGIILNRVAGKRHLGILRDSIAKYCGVPVVGAIPNLGDDSALIPGRHLGLITPSEYEYGAELRSMLLDIADNHLDVDGISEIAGAAETITSVRPDRPRGSSGNARIGYFKDSVFTFYYPENLEALERNGGQLVPVSSIADTGLPNVDALYIGGGFPETHADQLAGNRPMMESVRRAAAAGMPIYAECGGLIYLARSLKFEDRVYPMTGLFPIDLAMHAKPVGHGYTSIRVSAPNPFYPVGTSIRGHEFHYSGPEGGMQEVETCMKVEAGVGLGDARDGMVYANTLACYTHIHADGVEDWVSSMVSNAADYEMKRRDRKTENGTMGGGSQLVAI
uniref:Cobyrinic acid a,c-diamide synthase/siroheme a-amid synthase n=1 Tax=uncultured sulfate-reducing bacterium TaxID=153939 RepID=Q3IBL5_9BACT|nr:Cobyrinic acid a,c-diamide synthase/siroheme a-amid synthase [uncultured sulfate-reducing bacterium]